MAGQRVGYMRVSSIDQNPDRPAHWLLITGQTWLMAEYLRIVAIPHPRPQRSVLPDGFGGQFHVSRPDRVDGIPALAVEDH